VTLKFNVSQPSLIWSVLAAFQMKQEGGMQCQELRESESVFQAVVHTPL